MKTNVPTIRVKLFFALILSLSLAGKAISQPVVQPSTADNPIATVGEPFNSAMIYYNWTPNSAIFGIAWAGHIPIYVQDLATGVSATCPPAGTGTVPDVIIGNNFAHPNDYIMAVAYYDYGGHVVVDYYDITGVGTLGLAITYNSSNLIPIPFSMLTQDFNTVHLDIVAQYQPNVPLFPVCNKFVITTDDLTSGSIYVATGDLNLHSTSAMMTYPGWNGTMPDVAGIQRMMGGVHDLALITYVDPSGNLMYVEYDATTSAPLSAPVTMDNTATFTVPRIDAVDDYTNNNNPTLAEYKIAAAASPMLGASEIRTYDNLMGPLVYFASANAIDVSPFGYAPPPYNHYSPVVAITGPQLFQVFHWTEIGPSSDIAIMDPLDRSASYTLFPSNYYWVNSSTGTPVPSALVWIPGTWPISISSSVNTCAAVSSLNLYAWGENTGSGWVTKYKVSNSGPIGFKQQGTVGVSNVQKDSWKLYPNPAIDELTISQIGNKAATKYEVFDMSGKMLVSGTISSKNEKVNIGNLTSGSYEMKLFSSENSSESLSFLKY